MNPDDAIRARLAAQGYVDTGQRSLAEIQLGLRFSPALCAAGVAVGTVLASPAILLVMMATAVVGAVTPRHPFDLLYNHAVRFLIRRPPIPPNSAPRKFSCAVGAVWLAGTAGAFLAGWTIVGFALGAGMTAMAAFVAMTYICLPSLVYTRLFGGVGDVPEISVEEAAKELGLGASILDLRDAEFYQAGHAPGAVNISLAELSGGPTQFDRERPLLVVCQSGVMSLKGAKVLRDAGHARVFSVRGGMGAWLGLPVERDRTE